MLNTHLCSLFLLGWYETRSDIPKYLSWLFELDCLDLVWYLAVKLSILDQRPEYLSTERVELGAFVTSYRILFSTAVAFLGTIKATMCFYSNIPATTAIWFEWLLSGLVLSG